MGIGWVFLFGLLLIFMLGAITHGRLARDYQNRQDASVQTVAWVWALSSVHFGLVVLAASQSTWHFSLPAPIRIGGGLTLMGIGAAICLAAASAFRSFKRLNFMNHTRLVTEGIYGWSRNPGLVGWTLVLVGLGMVRESAMVLFLAFLMCGGYGLHLPIEEKHLRRVFGDAYEGYRQKTPRILGRRRRALTKP